LRSRESQLQTSLIRPFGALGAQLQVVGKLS